ncbi:hypothetical protein KQJ29_22610, partial [Enterococcus sp. S181_ASV_20]|nr:hypothetical protein [Enterococcus sp. S181_ASV_20]
MEIHLQYTHHYSTPNKETTVDETLFGDTIRVVSSPIFKRGFIHVYLLRLETSSYRQNWRKNRMLTIKQVERKNKNELDTLTVSYTHL